MSSNYGNDDRSIIFAVLGIVSAATVILLVLDINRIWMFGLLVILIVAHILTLRGYLRQAGMLTTAGGMVVLTSLIFINGGIRDTAMQGLIIIIIAASLLNGRIGAIAFGGMILLIVLILGIGEYQGWIINRFSAYNKIGDYFAIINIILLVTALQWAVISRLNENTRQAKAELAERKQAEKALRESEERYRFIVQEAPMGIIIIDQAGKIEQANPVALFMLGYAQREMVGADPSMLFDDHHADIQSTQTELTIRAERILVRKNGLRLTAMGGTKKMPDGRFLYIFQDISERKKAEEAARLLNEQLDQRVRERTIELEASNRELEASNRELEAFSYTISHDLRAPLRGIVGFSEILISDYDQQLPQDAHTMLKRISENGKQMGTMVDALLAFLRLGRQVLKKSYLHPKEIEIMLDEIIQTIGDEPPREVAWVIGELPGCKADPSLLKQVFTNLLSNAYKFTRGCDQARIEIGSTQTERGLAFFVRDNGTGFDMKYAGKLFGVFQRLHHADEFEGTGVGLAIAQRIILKHGGQIWVEAQPGQGATFFFILPD